MVSQNPAIRPTGLESIIAVQKSAVAGMRAVLRMRAMATNAGTRRFLDVGGRETIIGDSLVERNGFEPAVPSA
jgi:hypothetical protein